MKSWAQLIADTVRMGGVLVFVEDQAPAQLSEWLRPLQDDFPAKIPFTKRSLQDLKSRKYQTRHQDVVFFFEGQGQALKELNSVVQGQRVWVTETQSQPLYVDYGWHNVTLAAWKNFWQTLQPQFDSLIENWVHPETDLTPCLFLDRDDVVVKNVPYNRDPNQVVLLSGAVDLIRRAHVKGYWVALVTNQSGIGRGRISWGEYKQVHQRMLHLLAQQGAWIDECVWSSFIENEAVPEGRMLASLRKPRAGMFQLVQDKLKVDMKKSIMIGDSATDLMAAHGAGVGACYLFHSEKFETEQNTLELFRVSHSGFSYSELRDFSDIVI